VFDVPLFPHALPPCLYLTCLLPTMLPYNSRHCPMIVGIVAPVMQGRSASCRGPHGSTGRQGMLW
jgi:hypothetical protein